MNHTISTALFALSMLIIGACQPKQSNSIKFSNPHIQYEGRMDTSDGVNLYWSGSSVKLQFKGTNLLALLKDQTGDNYYNIIIDGDSLVLLRPDTTKQYYTIVENLPYGEHRVELFKRTEWDRGKSTFYGFKSKGTIELVAQAKSKRKIEFYGNSITAAYAVEDSSGADSPDSTFTNNYLSYARITADYFNAQYHCSCKSGIGIMISWFPMIMPEIYDRTNPEDSNSTWDFENYQPDILVLNLFQNDSWLIHMPEQPEFKTYLGSETPNEDFIVEAYKSFVSKLRAAYPNTQIICMLGNMDITKDSSPWPAYVKRAVLELNDAEIHTYFAPYKNSPGHPSINEQEILANGLIEFIEENIRW